MKHVSKYNRSRLLWSGGAAAAIGLASLVHATDIGLNFVDDWGTGGGAAVTGDAFGVAADHWYNMPAIYNSEGGSGVSSNTVITLPEGGSLAVEWSCINTYSLPADPPEGPGGDQAIYGYLDDTGVGYRVRVSGLRNVASDYTVTLIASTDGGDGFGDAFVSFGSGTNVVEYTEILSPDYASGAYSTSSTSGVIPTLSTNNSVVLTGSPRDGSRRSTLAAILIQYTPGGQNPPIIELEPRAPEGTTYVGSSFELASLASGSSPLAYQWRRGGTPIPDAAGPVFSRTNATLLDGGDYDVVASNGYGSVTSRVVTLVVSPTVKPDITTAPVSQTPYPGYPVTFSVEATGGQLAYQWSRGTDPIAGANNTTLALPSVSAGDQGTYTVTVSNGAGNSSASATLSLAEASSPYAAAVAASKPIVYFRMSETGPVDQDQATNRGSLGTAGTGLYAGALSHLAEGALVGSSDTAVTLGGGRIAVGFDASLNPPGSFTVECWAKPSDAGSGNRVLVQSMINGENTDNASDRSGWAFRQNAASLQFLIGGADGAPFYTATVSAGDAVTAGVWNHYAAVYDSAALTVSLLVNGVIVTNVTVDAPVLPNFAAPLLVGDRGYGGWAFKGSLDEVALYSTALTTAQLRAHYEAGINAATSANYPSLVTAAGAVEYLRLDDAGLPPTANAAVNNGTLGTAWAGTYAGGGSILGNPLIAKGTVGPRPEAFPGLEPGNTAVAMTNGWVTSPRLALGNQVTAVAWLNREEISTTGDLSWPAWLGGGGLHLNNGNASNPDAELRYHWNGEKWDWGSGLFVPPNVWTFVALVVAPDEVTIYMSDGTTLLSSSNTTDHAPMIVTSPPGFGGNQPDRADRNYIGQIDEAAVYDRALSPEEITAVFNAAFTIPPPPPSNLVLTPSGGQYILTWTSGALQASSTLSGEFIDVAGATSPYVMATGGDGAYYRLRSN